MPHRNGSVDIKHAGESLNPKKTFQSFRHTLIDDLRDAGVQDSLIKRIAGHEDGAVTSSVYESSSPLKAMLEALVQINLHIDLGR